MNRIELINLITKIVQDFLSTSAAGEALTEESRLFGEEGLFDSLGLVNVVLEVEEQINDRIDGAVSLVDDRAMSQERSPFRTIGALADYALMLIEARDEG